MDNDKMRESINDLRHSIVVDGYTEDQKGFLQALANRLEMIADGTFTQQPESEPIGYAQAYELERLTRWELNLSQGGIDEDDCGQFVRFDDLEELLAAASSIGEKNDG